MVKVLIADDQQLIRDSLRIVLGSYPEIEVSGVAGDGFEVLAEIERDVPDVILMDIRMPRMDGVMATREIKERFPAVKIIILTTFDDDEFVFSALRHGASGYLLKGVGMEELRQAILTVETGGAMINPDIAAKVVKQFSHMNENALAIQTVEGAEKELTPTEWKIVREVSRGYSNKEIAGRLHFSEGTIRNNLSSVLSKLGLRDRTQLAIWAVTSHPDLG